MGGKTVVIGFLLLDGIDRVMTSRKSHQVFRGQARHAAKIPSRIGKRDLCITVQVSELRCAIGVCPYPPARRGLCWMHYKRWLRFAGTGPSGRMGRKATLEERFIDRVRLGPGPCYIWMGYVHKPSGFGALVTGHRFIYVHRYAWERAYGPIPPKAKVIQTCRNRLCVRPDHLELR
jgi:hypothetical protein